MRHASFFSGIGGFDLAAHWMGWENVLQVEIDEWSRKLLATRFPNTKQYGDIREFDGTEYRGAIDIISGGFPCQPFSTAGQRKGEKDSRHLWPEMLRVICEIQPAWVVGENVAGIVSMENGGTLDRILNSLEGEGYKVQTFTIPASGVGAVHRRDRVWIVAYNEKWTNRPYNAEQAERQKQQSGKGSGSGIDSHNAQRFRCNGETSQSGECEKTQFTDRGFCADALPTNPNGKQQKERTQDGIQSDQAKEGARLDDRTSRHGRAGNATDTIRNTGGEECEFAAISEKSEQCCRVGYPPELLRLTQSPVCGTNDGIPAGMDKPKHTKPRLKGLGNAIVPQVAFEIFKAIQVCQDAQTAKTATTAQS